MDIHLEAFRNISMVYPIYTVPLTPSVIPGLLNFGPAIIFSVGVSYDSNEPIDTRFGFDVSHPFSYELSSDSVLGLPKMTSTGSPVFTKHPLEVNKSFDVTLKAHFIPQIGLALMLFNLNMMSVSVGLDSQVGYELSAASCPPKSRKHNIFAEFDGMFSCFNPGHFQILNVKTNKSHNHSKRRFKNGSIST